METKLHITLKNAVGEHLAVGSRCQYEAEMSPWSGRGSQRADVHYYRKSRSYYVECETRPNLERLREKGRRRLKSPWADAYILVVPEAQFGMHDWETLRGLYNEVYGYNVEENRFTCALDLRTLGALQDMTLDVVMPVVRNRRVRTFHSSIVRKKNIYSHCLNCLRGRICPWLRCLDEPCILYKRLLGDPSDHWKWSN